MKAETSSLNPYAASYIPLSRRGSATKDYKSGHEGVWVGSQSEDMAKSMQQSVSLGYNADPLHGGQGFPLKGHPVLGIYGSTFHNANETTYKPTTDEEFDIDLAYLQTMFPGISEDSLSEVYLASGGDLEAAVEMLNQLEEYPGDSSSENLPDSLDIGDICETGTSSDGASQKLKVVASEVGGSSCGTTVLSDEQKRKIYDQYGEEGLKDMPPADSSNSGGFPNGFNPRNAEDIFAEFFGRSPFGFGSAGPGKSMRFSSDSGGIFGGFGGGDNIFRNYSDGTGASIPKKPAPVESKLPCSLEDLYSGSTRKMKISRTVIDSNGRPMQETEILTIDVNPGWKKGTKITFPDKGNEQLNQLPADLVFVINEKPHSIFKRDSNDLIMNYRVSLAEALGGCTVNISTLDGRQLPITVNDIVSPGYELVVHGEGMPIAKEPGNRGDLKIIFEVKFPTRLTVEQRTALRRTLGG